MLADLLEYISDNFTIDAESRITTNALNQPIVKIAVCRMGYSIVDNTDGTFEVGVMSPSDDMLLTFPNVSAEDVVGVIAHFSNKQLVELLSDRNALKHSIVGVPVTIGDKSIL